MSRVAPIAALLCASLCLTGCPMRPPTSGDRVLDGPFAPDVNDSWAGSIEADSITISAGITFTATGDLRLKSRTKVEIMGALLAEIDEGHSIAIEAEGTITIAGRVVSSNGQAGANGGALTLISKNGDIILLDGSLIASGAGGTGAVPALAVGFQGGAGGNGGDLILNAINGSIQFAPGASSVHVGHGGDGANIVITRAEQTSSGNSLPEEFTNAGGNAGALELKAANLAGLTLQETTLTQDYVVEGQVLAAAGAVVRTLQSSQISGGVGGQGGRVEIGLDSDTNTFSPIITKPSLRSSQPGFDLVLIARGAAGGSGIRSPGQGGRVYAVGCNGQALGQCGQDVFATGGMGGNCSEVRVFPPLMLISCTSGNGGNAIAVAGFGAKGADPSGTGGCGGKAEANGGAPGLYASFTRGCFGSAESHGGNGGDGGNACPSQGSVGGMGGRGGDGISKYNTTSTGFGTGGELSACGDSTAFGGNGGNGGDGLVQGGRRGERGEAMLDQITAGTLMAGLPGRPGNPGHDGPTCPVAGMLEGCGTPPGGIPDALPRIPTGGFRVTKTAVAPGSFPLAPNGVNDRRLAVGSVGPPQGHPAEPLLILNDRWSSLPHNLPLDGSASSPVESLRASRINNQCELIGEFRRPVQPPQDPLDEAFFLQLSGRRVLFQFKPREIAQVDADEFHVIAPLDGQRNARANDLSENGIVAVTSFINVISFKPAFWNGATVALPLADPQARGQANGISRDGTRIAGSEANSAVVWSGDGFQTRQVLPDLVAGGGSNALDVEGNRVIGISLNGPQSNFSSQFQPVLWIDGGPPINLNTVGAAAGNANALTPAGLVVGLLRMPNATLAAFAFTADDGTVLLDTRIDAAAEGITLLNATAVNRLNDIVCHAADSTGQQLYVHLTPN